MEERKQRFKIDDSVYRCLGLTERTNKYLIMEAAIYTHVLKYGFVSRHWQNVEPPSQIYEAILFSLKTARS